MGLMKILFVCSGNAHRSPLAEALLKKLRPDLNVDSAGLGVAIPIAEQVREYLAKEDAEQFLKKYPESLSNKRLDGYDLIIAMQSGHKDAVLNRCPECQNRVAVWDVEDPYFLDEKEAEKIYDQIKRKVGELAGTL
jgi:protein-tyrosine phosphatase